MSLVQESYLQSLLLQCDQLSQRQEREARESIVRNLDKIYTIFKDNVKEAFSKFSLDVLVRFTQIAVQNSARFEQATHILELLFERFTSSSQFYIRALLVKAKVIAYTAHRVSEKGQDMLVSLKESIGCISKALDLIAPQQEGGGGKGKDPKAAQGADSSNKARYGFLIYNASTTLYKVTRFMLRPGWQKSFAEIYERVYKLLEEVEEADHNWRCRFTMILYQCLYDADKKPDAFKVLDTLWEKTKNKPCDFQDSLFRLRCFLCKQNNAMAANIKKDIEGADPNGWKILEPLQRMRSGLIPEAQIEKQLMAIVNQISLGVLSNNEGANHTQISAVMQERLAEAGRVALRFNLVGLASSIVSYLGKTVQLNQRALILNEYNKAQLLIKKKGDYVDKNTGMSMSMNQIKEAEIQNRKEALRVMEKVMLINKKLNNAELIYQGAILVWNIALPFLSPQYHQYAVRALDLSLSLIEQIDSNDHELRTKFHLQLISIYFGNDLMFSEVQSNVFKALRLDPSIPQSKLATKPDQQEDPSLYTRPYHRYLSEFRQKVLLKTMQIHDPTPLDLVTQDLWTIEDQKSQTTKIDMLQKCLKTLLSYEEPPFVTKEEQMLVEEEIKERKLEYDRQKLRSLKRKKLLAAQIAKLSFEWDLNDFSKKACEFVLVDNWDVKNSIELIIAQGHCSLYMAQIKIDEIYQLNSEPLFGEEEEAMKEEQKKEVQEKKSEVVSFLKKSLDYAQISQQSYLTFNGAICIWNNFLHLFRVNANDSKLRPDVVDILKEYFEAMRNILKDVETKATIYYDLDTKIQAFSNIGLVYARILEGQKQTAQVQKVCEDLLLTNLSPNTRKLINGIKARVSGGKAPAGGGGKADPKKGAAPPQRTAGFNDTFILEIDNQLELIQNAQNKSELEGQIIKCFQSLDGWKPNQQDESELELHAQLWVKLARLASEQKNSKMLKYSLRCSEKALSQYKNLNSSTIPPNRLRWYSLADFLSSSTLLKLVNSKTQENSSVEVLLFLSLSRAVEAAAKGFKCGINILVVDAGKQLWNVCSQLQQSKINRQKLEKPIAQILGYLKELKEDSEPDLLLLLSQLFFKIAWENEHYKTGQAVTDMMLDLLPKTLQRSVWEAKMGFMSKQGKNQLQAISSIKEAEPSLQAKLWVKLARIAPNPSKQQTSYKKALQILKKQNSVEIVEILIEYSEWQLRVGKQPLPMVIKNLQYASNLLVAIEEGNELEEDEVEDDHMTLNSQSRSRSHTSKRSGASKTVKSSQRDAKKEKKITVSSKSKASRVSRMNRSGRGQKTVNNKNAKSVFSQREEDPNPESLTCVHYERLFRIYTILASISKEGSAKISYALNACRHIESLLKKSINTFNELQENAAKLNEKDEKIKLKIQKVPETIDEWISYEFPKEYLQKIEKVVDNTSFLGVSTLQKPQLTYAYLLKLSKLMSGIGLDYETIPLNFLSKYLTKYILKNENYWLLQQLKLKSILTKCRHPSDATVSINFKDFTIGEEEIKEQILKAENQRSNSSEGTNNFDYHSTPNLIKPLSKFNFWFQVGQVLIEFGQIATAKIYLNESLKCAKIMNSLEIIGKIHLHLCQIGCLEGEQEEAMKHLALAHRLCKSLDEWQKVVELASNIMLSLKKYDQLKTFLAKVISTTAELINENQKDSKEVTNFKSEVSELVQLALSVEISSVSLSFLIMLEQNTKENRIDFTHSLYDVQKTIRENQSILWNMNNVQRICQQFKKIFKYYENRGGKQLIDLEFKNFRKMIEILNIVYGGSKEFSKNKGLRQAEGGFYNSLIDHQVHLGFLLANSLSVQYQLSSLTEAAEDNDANDVQNELVKTFLQTMNKEVEQHKKPVETELSCVEEALTILNDIDAHIQQSSVHYPRLQAMQAYVLTLRDYKSEQSIEAGFNFKGQVENRLSKFQQDSHCYQFQAKVYEALSCQVAEDQSPQFFQYLSKYQQAISVDSMFEFLKKKLKPNHRFLSALQLLERNVNQSFRDRLLQREKLFGSLSKFPSYQDSLKFVPKNSLYIVIQLNKTKTKMMVAVMESESDPNNKKFRNKTKEISDKQLRTYKHCLDMLTDHKKKILKTTFENVAKIQTTIADSEAKLRETKNTLESLNGWWLKEVIDCLKKPKEAPPPTNQKDKKAAKDQKKKGGKDEVAAYESPLPPSPSGIESVTFLLDEFLYSLPFEEMIPAQLVSSVSKDSSLFWNARKLQQIGFNSELNNSNGVGADKGKYFSYDFKNPEYNFKEIATEIGKGPEAVKFDGTDSSSRMPSVGDYIDAVGKPGFLQIYGSTDILNHLRLNSFVEYASQSKLRLLIIHDCLNFPKQMLNKQKDIVEDSPSVLLEEFDEAFALLSNLLNLTIIKSRWMAPPEQMLVHIKQTYQSLGKGLYIGSVLRQNRKETDKISDLFMTYIHGPAVIRL